MILTRDDNGDSDGREMRSKGRGHDTSAGSQRYKEDARWTQGAAPKRFCQNARPISMTNPVARREKAAGSGVATGVRSVSVDPLLKPQPGT